MEVKGRIDKICEMKSGQGQRGEWHSLDIIVMQELGSAYPKKAMVTIFGDTALAAAKDLCEGHDVTLQIDIECKEWNGRFYNTVKCWKYQIDRPISTSAPAPQSQTNSGPPQAQDHGDNLPF